MANPFKQMLLGLVQHMPCPLIRAVISVASVPVNFRPQAHFEQGFERCYLLATYSENPGHEQADV